MKPPSHLSKEIAVVWAEQVEALGDLAGRRIGPEFEAYCGVIARLRDAQARIAEEELVVPNSKNQPVIHPAFSVERQCLDDLRKWGDRFKPRSR